MGTFTINPDQIRESVLGRDAAVPRLKAFRMMAESDYADREVLLTRVMEDPTEPVRIRSAAATAMGRIATANAEEILLRNLRQANPEVAPDLLRALARTGHPAARDAIESVRFSDMESQHAALFAARLISYRHRLPGYDWPQPHDRELLPRPAASRNVMRIMAGQPRDSEQAFADLAHEPLAASLSPRGVTRVDCGPVSNAVFINQEFVAGATPENVFREKALFGAVAVPSRESGMHYLGYLILTSPENGRIGVVLTRPSGTMILAGWGTADGSVVDFSIRAVDRPGASAMYLDGTFGSGALNVRTAEVSAERVPGKQPIH